MTDRIALIGAGPLGLNMAGVVGRLPEYEFSGFLDTKSAPIGGIDVLGDDTVLDDLFDDGIRLLVVCLGNSERRVAKAIGPRDRGFGWPEVTDPSADLGVGVRVSDGGIILPGAIVLPEAEVGEFCVVEAGPFVGHHTRLGTGCPLGHAIAGREPRCRGRPGHDRDGYQPASQGTARRLPSLEVKP